VDLTAWKGVALYNECTLTPHPSRLLQSALCIRISAFILKTQTHQAETSRTEAPAPLVGMTGILTTAERQEIRVEAAGLANGYTT
jgi:hypothetical protein